MLSTDQHTVKPWFNGRLDVAPPVIDLTALGFTLIGGRLDYIDARPVGAMVYRRRLHVINLFVAQTASTETRAARTETFQGFNVRSWSERAELLGRERHRRRRTRRIQRQVPDRDEDERGVRLELLWSPCDTVFVATIKTWRLFQSMAFHAGRRYWRRPKASARRR